MKKNTWKKIGRIKIRPIDIILAVLIILAASFLPTVSAGADKEKETVGGQEYKEEEEAAGLPIAGITKTLQETLKEAQEIEAAQEAETKITKAKKEKPQKKPKRVEKESAVYIEEIPLSKEFQKYFYDHAKEFDCPLALAYGTADVETDFIKTVVGAAGEIGLMQTLPGRNGKYLDAIKQECGYDPRTDEGNVAAGCYLLGKYYKKYGSVELAAMAYNMGEGGAARLWKQGIYSSEYSRKIYKAYQKWSVVLEEAGVTI